VRVVDIRGSTAGSDSMTTICFLESETMFTRLLRSRFHSDVHESILGEARLKPTEEAALLKEYDRTGNMEKRMKMLENASKMLESRHAPFYKNHTWEEILAQHIYKAVNQSRAFNDIFGHVVNEDELYGMLRNHLKRDGYTVYETYDLRGGGRWPDLYAVKRGRLGGIRTISVDAKVNYDAFKRLHEQCATFARFSNQVFVATTPGMVAEVGVEQEYSVAHGEAAFKRLVEPAGAGAYVIDMASKEISKAFEASGSRELDKEERNGKLRYLEYER